MLVSVVLPVHDDAVHLTGALQRLAAQRYDELEVVVVDDGSTDGSADVVREAATRDGRVRLVQLPVNGGVARAREAGVRASRGRYVWFVDSDDTWSETALTDMVGVARAAQADVVVAAALLHPAGGGRSQPLGVPGAPAPVDGRTALEMVFTGTVTGHLWNKLFSRELLLRCEFVPARVQSDLALVVGALARARVVAFSPALVYEYQVRSGSIITSTRRRSESLRLIESGARQVVQEVDPALLGSEAFRYFTARYVVLSGIKDAVLADYSSAERAELLRTLRKRLTLEDIGLLARRRDAKRLALAVAAKSSTRVYRALLARAGG